MLDPTSMLADDDAEAEVGRALHEVPQSTLRAFAGGVLLAQVGLFAVSLGVLVAAFRDQTVLGAAFVAVGVGSLLATLVIVRRQDRGR